LQGYNSATLQYLRLGKQDVGSDLSLDAWKAWKVSLVVWLDGWLVG
jgi:hypothetical protein